MAAPTLHAGNASNTTNLGAVALALPTTTPAINDRIFACIAHRDQAIGQPTMSGGTGFGVWTCPWGTVSTGATFLTVWTADVQSASPTGPTVSDSGDHQQHRSFYIRHASGLPAIHTWNTGTEGVSDTSGSHAGPTTTVDECLMLFFCSSDTPDLTNTTEHSAQANASLTGVGLIWANLGNAVATGGGSSKAAFLGTLNTAGSSGTFTYTKATNGVKAHLAVAVSGPTLLPPLMTARR